MFAVSKALEKEEFIALYSDVILLSSLLVAPFGLPRHTSIIFTEKDYVVNELLPTYRHCEEYFAKRLFAIRGVSDDVIAATMHAFVEEKNDAEISSLFRLGATTLRNMVESPSVTELPVGLTAEWTANLLNGVMNVMKDFGCDFKKNINLNVKDRVLSAGRTSMIVNEIVEAMSTDCILQLLELFKYPSERFSAFPSGVADAILSYEQYQAALEAYYCDQKVQDVWTKWWGTKVATNDSCCNREFLERVRTGVHFICPQNCSDAEHFSMNSVFSGLLQADLFAIFESEMKASGDLGEYGAWNDRSQQLLSIIQLRSEALHSLHQINSNVYGMNIQKDAARDNGWNMGDILTAADANPESVGDAMAAMSSFDTAIEAAIETNVRYPGSIPNLILAELMADRTVCRYCLGDFDGALSDCNHSLELNSSNVSALSVRARLLQNSAMECISGGYREEECDIWEGDVSSSSSVLSSPRMSDIRAVLVEHCSLTGSKSRDIVEVKALLGNSLSSSILYSSAKDAMRSYILGGAVDQALAALAEDCVRNACRREAKDYFWKSLTRSQKKDIEGMSPRHSACYDERGHLKLPNSWEEAFEKLLPRAWTVNMYLQSFEPLEISLDLYVNETSTITCKQRAADLMLHSDMGEALDYSGIDDDNSSTKLNEITMMVHLIPEGSLLRSDDMMAFRFLCCLVEALNYSNYEMTSDNYNDTAAEYINFSPLGEDSALSSRCSKGLMEALRLLYSHCDGFYKPGTIECDRKLPLQLPIGVEISVQLDSESVGVPTLVDSEFDEFIPRLTFRPSPRLEKRIHALKDLCRSNAGSDVSDMEHESSTYSISASILSRILSVISSVAHLCGDDVGAYECLSAAIDLGEDIEGHNHYYDSRLKMGCLLIEMHDFDEAEAYFVDKVPVSMNSPYASLVTNLHFAELHVHRFDYESAAKSIDLALRCPTSSYANTNCIASNCLHVLGCSKSTNRSIMLAPVVELYSEDLGGKNADLHRRICSRLVRHQSALSSTAESMKGLIQLRLNPSDAQGPLRLLKSAYTKYPENAALCNCIGEVLGQSGDAAGALAEFRRAYIMSQNNPMPLLNAARVYQQMGQSVASEAHVREALLRDNTLVLAYVDCAQLCLQQISRGSYNLSAEGDISEIEVLEAFKGNKAKEAYKYLDKALSLCRHISEVADVFATKVIAKIHFDVLEEEAYGKKK